MLKKKKRPSDLLIESEKRADEKNRGASSKRARLTQTLAPQSSTENTREAASPKTVKTKTRKRTIVKKSPEAKSTRRPILSADGRAILMKWFHSHWDAPYPSPEQKRKLAVAVGLRLEQVQSWFINTRIRYWKRKKNKRDFESKLTSVQPPVLRDLVSRRPKTRSSDAPQLASPVSTDEDEVDAAPSSPPADKLAREPPEESPIESDDSLTLPGDLLTLPSALSDTLSILPPFSEKKVILPELVLAWPTLTGLCSPAGSLEPPLLESWRPFC